MITIWVPKRLVEVGLYNVAARSPQELAALSEQSYRDRVKYAAEKVRFSGTKIVTVSYTHLDVYKRQMLADLTHQKKKKTLKRLKKSIRKGWLNAWLDEKTETVYLTAEDYREMCIRDRC